jgi:hypothetical protein
MVAASPRARSCRSVPDIPRAPFAIRFGAGRASDASGAGPNHRCREGSVTEVPQLVRGKALIEQHLIQIKKWDIFPLMPMALR